MVHAQSSPVCACALVCAQLTVVLSMFIVHPHQKVLRLLLRIVPCAQLTKVLWLLTGRRRLIPPVVPSSTRHDPDWAMQSPNQTDRSMCFHILLGSSSSSSSRLVALLCINNNNCSVAGLLHASRLRTTVQRGAS